MTLKTITVVSFYCFYSIVCYSQAMRHPTKIENGSCSAYTNDFQWQDIIDQSLLKSTPFNKILHLSFKRKNDIKHYGTASFISENLLVTARHILDSEENLEYIELNIPSSNNRWVRLDKRDYKIYYYTEYFKKADDDIVLLKIINKQKLELLYFGHFDLTDSISSKMSKEVNLTGFPFIKFAIHSIASDTLVNRSLSYKLLQFNTINTLIGLPVCTCNGDSGGPVWIKSGDQYLILGVCGRGGMNAKEYGFDNPNLNVSTFINNNVLQWIKTIETTSLLGSSTASQRGRCVEK